MNSRILVVEDDASFRASLLCTLDIAGIDYLAVDSGAAALAAARDERFALVLSDVQMSNVDGMTLLRSLKRADPDLPVLLMTAHSTVEQAVEAMRHGADDYLPKPFEPEVVVGRVTGLRREVDPTDGDPIAVDPASCELLTLARRVAASEVTVFLCGESGTGKEVFARYIHRHSRRAPGPFVAINCAAIPENMLEAVLFGYEKGAFTGAHKACPGKFEQAQGGTLLLDEVTEMDLGLQAKLLRVLQEREVERLGSRETIGLDVRVLAASNQNLAAAVANGAFREDLFYRLNVFPLRLAPLRERAGDIVPLAEHLIAREARNARRDPPALTSAARAALVAHPWPGNVRELDNVVQRAMVLAVDDTIEAWHLGLEGVLVGAAAGSLAAALAVGASAATTEALVDDEGTLDAGLRERESRIILEALASEGSRKAAAERLGISPRTLRYKLARMREHGVAVPG